MTRQYLFSSGTLTISPGSSSSPEPSTSHRSSQPQLFFSGILTLDNTPPQPDPSPTLDEISDDDQQLPEIAVLAEASCSSPPPTNKHDEHDHGNILRDNSIIIDELSEDQVVLHVPLEQHDKFRRIVHSPGSYSYFFVSRHGQIDEIEVKTSLRHVTAHPLFERQQDTIVDAACLVFDGSKSTVITGCIQEDKQLISRPLSSIISAQTLERPWNKSKKCGVSALTAMIQPHMFASGGYDHQIHLWDLSPTRSSPSSSAIQLSPTSKPLSMKHLSAVQSLLPLRDSSHKLISGGADCVLNAYDLPSERIFNTLKTSNSIYNVHDVASPYCVLLEVAHRDLQFEVRDYRAVSERPVMRFGYECQQVAGKFVRGSSSPQQDLFACGDREGNVRLWDMRNTNHPSKQVVCAQGQKIAQVMFHDDTQLLVCTEGNGAMLIGVKD